MVPGINNSKPTTRSSLTVKLQKANRARKFGLSKYAFTPYRKGPMVQRQSKLLAPVSVAGSTKSWPHRCAETCGGRVSTNVNFTLQALAEYAEMSVQDKRNLYVRTRMNPGRVVYIIADHLLWNGGCATDPHVVIQLNFGEY